ncbi:MAG: cytochrome c maturation protein CcmE [Chloroflexi bacterium]|nr:cytochrome c maturation protein CcmE [Chloroflexota bacterium]
MDQEAAKPPPSPATLPLPLHRSPLGGQVKLLVAIGLLAAALAYFAFAAFQGATVFYLTVGELLDGRAEAEKVVRVSGKLVPGSFQREGSGTLATFSLTDGVRVLPAKHDGALPDLFFNELSDIVLEGTYAAGRPFAAREVIVKCPSKYVARPAQQGPAP